MKNVKNTIFVEGRQSEEALIIDGLQIRIC